MNISVKFISFYLDQFQRYGVLKNEQLFGPPYTYVGIGRILCFAQRCILIMRQLSWTHTSVSSHRTAYSSREYPVRGHGIFVWRVHLPSKSTTRRRVGMFERRTGTKRRRCGSELPRVRSGVPTCTSRPGSPRRHPNAESPRSDRQSSRWHQSKHKCKNVFYVFFYFGHFFYVFAFFIFQTFFHFLKTLTKFNGFINNRILSSRPNYTVSQKTRHLTLAHNFTKYWPIFKILSLLDSVGNL